MSRSVSARSVSVAAVFHALGDPTRRVIVEKLSERPLSASLLAGPLGISVAAVVQHLGILEAGGLIRSEKVGRIRACRIEPAGLKTLEDWVDERRMLWEARLDRLNDLLEEKDVLEEGAEPEPSGNKSGALGKRIHNPGRSRPKSAGESV